MTRQDLPHVLHMMIAERAGDPVGSVPVWM